MSSNSSKISSGKKRITRPINFVKTSVGATPPATPKRIAKVSFTKTTSTPQTQENNPLESSDEDSYSPPVKVSKPSVSQIDASSLLESDDDDEGNEPADNFLSLSRESAINAVENGEAQTCKIVEKYSEEVKSIVGVKFDVLFRKVSTLDEQQRQILENQNVILEKLNEISNGNTIIVPRELSRKVKSFYRELPENEKWNLEKVFTDDVNVDLTQQFIDDMKELLKEFSTDQIRKCCHTYFVSLRKSDRAKTADPEKFEQEGIIKKFRLRRQRLLESRSAFVLPNERSLWEGVTQEVMSDVEDGEGVFKKKSPPWRIPKLSSLIKKLDKRIKEDAKQRNVMVPKVKRIISLSPIKRKPTKKVKPKFLKDD